MFAQNREKWTPPATFFDFEKKFFSLHPIAQGHKRTCTFTLSLFYAERQAGKLSAEVWGWSSQPPEAIGGLLFCN